MTVWIAVKCPGCYSTDVVKHGRSGEGKQRYLCQNSDCPKRTFMINYTYQGCQKEVKRKIPEMAINGNGIRETARLLKISSHTVISELKKKHLR
ncbi:MAG: IS1-like element transposase [Microcystaceae cyanobacterium]